MADIKVCNHCKRELPLDAFAWRWKKMSMIQVYIEEELDNHPKIDHHSHKSPRRLSSRKRVNARDRFQRTSQRAQYP